MRVNNLSTALILSGLVIGSAQAQSNNSSGTFDTFISGGLGWGGLNTNGVNPTQDNGLIGQARVSGAYTDKTGLGGQMDVVYSSQSISNTYIETLNMSAFDIAAHLFYRNENLLGGAFMQRRTVNLSYGNMNVSAPVINTNMYGVEGQAYVGNVTLYGQVGGQTMQSIYNGGTNGISGVIGSLEARYFIKENWRVEAGYSYAGLSTSNVNYSDIPFKTNSNTFLVGSEYRIENTPVSLFAQYEYSNQAYPSYYEGSSNTSRALVGFKVSFGTGTLLQRDRSGATLNPIRNNSSLYSGIGPI